MIGFSRGPMRLAPISLMRQVSLLLVVFLLLTSPLRSQSGGSAVRYYESGIAKKAKGDLDGAIADYSKAIESPPNDHLSETYNNRGTIRHESGDNVGAVADFTKAIEIDSKNVFAYANRGYALILLNEDTEAHKDFEQVLKINPSLQP